MQVWKERRKYVQRDGKSMYTFDLEAVNAHVIQCKMIRRVYRFYGTESCARCKAAKDYHRGSGPRVCANKVYEIAHGPDHFDTIHFDENGKEVKMYHTFGMHGQRLHPLDRYGLVAEEA